MIEIQDFSAFGSGIIDWSENGVQQPTYGSIHFEKTYNEPIKITGVNYGESLYVEPYEDNGVKRTITFNSSEIEVDKKLYIGGLVYLNGQNIIFNNATSEFYSDGSLYLIGNSILNIVFNFTNNGLLSLSEGSFNFDTTTWSTISQNIEFGENSSINITTASNGKTLIKASTLTGTITLDVDDDVQDGASFNIEATDNQLTITDPTGWAITPSTVGTVTTYTLAKSEPVPVVGKYNKKMLRKKLALMLATLKKKRPYYVECEYLESTGTQYIDTNVTGNVDTKIDILFSKKNPGTSYATYGLVGARGATVNTNNISVGCALSNLAMDFNNSSYSNYRYATNTSEDTIYRAVISKEARTLYQGNTIVGQNTTLCTDNIQTNNIWIFKIENYGSLSAKVRYCKIYDDDVLVRDFIPVLDWDMTPCMYDKVSGELFYNKGTGEFVPGRQIHPVEYLQSTGTQYIDTGINASGYKGCELKACYTTIIDNTFFIGAYNTDGVDGFQVGSFTDKWRLKYGNVGYFGSNVDTNVHIFKANRPEGSYVDDTLLGTSYISIPNSATRNLYLFKRNALNASNEVVGNIYYCKLYDNNTLVRDYIPAIDENGVGFMFDRVSHTIYDNAGTGAFGYNPVELEYIESDGTQYIDTGVLPKAYSTSVDFMFSLNQLYTSGVAIFGSRNSNDVLAGKSYNMFTGTVEGSNRIRNDWSYNASTAPYKTNKFVLTNIISADEKIRVQLNADSSSQINDDIFSKSGVTKTDCDYPMYLGTINTGGTAFAGKPSAKWYYCKIYEDSSTVRDLVPCFKDGSAGMWDKVNNVFYQSLSGTFTAGAIVEPEYE